MKNGSEIDPADLWYALITLYEEVEIAVDLRGQESPIYRDENMEKNRRAWNGWACRGIYEKARREIEKQLELNEGDLDEWKSQEQNEIEQKMIKFLLNGNYSIDHALIKRVGIERFLDEKFKLILKSEDGEEYSAGPIKLENKIFRNVIYTNKFVFNMMHFSDSKFYGNVYFIDSFFNSTAHFQKTAFYSHLCFHNADFSLRADFRYAEFRGEAMFSCANFDGKADFSDASFHSPAIFQGAKFKDIIIFNRTKFKEKTNFNDAIFENYVPKFYDAKMHKDTKFTLKARDYWPHPREDAEGGKNAYTNLIQLMRGQQKPDDEHFFYRQEMAWKAQHEGWLSWLVTRPYEWFSGYGHSLGRPFWWFLLMLSLPLLLIALDIWGYGIPQDSFVAYLKGEIGCVLRFSTENMLPLFEFMDDHKPRCKLPFHEITWLWSVISVVQYLASVALLFLFGLALRNRFRLGA